MKSWNSDFWVSLYPFISYFPPSVSLSLFSLRRRHLLFTYIHFSFPSRHFGKVLGWKGSDRCHSCVEISQLTWNTHQYFLPEIVKMHVEKEIQKAQSSLDSPTALFKAAKLASSDWEINFFIQPSPKYFNFLCQLTFHYVFSHVGFYYFINLPISLDISSLNMLDWASNFNFPNLYIQR